MADAFAHIAAIIDAAGPVTAPDCAVVAPTPATKPARAARTDPAPSASFPAAAAADPPAVPPAATGGNKKASSRTGQSGAKPADAEKAAGAAKRALDLKLAWLPQTDLGNVERFVARWRHLIRWCGATGWHFWDGKRWSRKGADSFVLRAEHATVRAIQDEAAAAEKGGDELVPLLTHGAVDPAAKAARKSEAAERKKQGVALGKLATSLRAWGRKSEQISKMPLSKRARANLEIHHEEFDADPFMINVNNGTLVARRPAECPEGEDLIILKPHDPADFITKISPVDYDPVAECPEFDKFFARVQPSERQRRFLMQWHGYSLTGDAEEQRLCVYYGSGRNGKGTLMETCAYIAGDYADSVPVETFLVSSIQKSGGQATPDLAKLPGVRFLRTGEPDKGARLGEALIKRVTGGDPIDARNLNKEFFTFFAQFKLTIACNHKPRIGGADDGIWGRMTLIPWLVFIPPSERDPELKAKLRREGCGILNRLLDGLRDWLEHGLILGEEIEAATAKYRRDSDAVGRFLEDCTVADPAARAQSSMLYDVYCAWAKCNDGPPYKQKGFSGILDDRGYERIQNNVMFWIGLRLVKSANDFVDHEGRPLHQAHAKAPVPEPDDGGGGDDDDDMGF